MLVRSVLAVCLLAVAVDARTTSVSLTAPERAAGDRYGAALDGAGTTLAVGAPGTGGRGAVHVYAQSSGAWALQATLTAPDAQPGDELGAAVALDGDTLAVGAPGRGVVYVFTRAGDVWDAGVAVVPTVAGRAGAAVDVAGDLLVVGAPDAGAAEAFVRAGGVWTSIGAAVDGTAVQAGDRAGHAVATDGTWVIVGAPGRDGGGGLVDAGIAFVGSRNGGAVVPVTSLSPRFPHANARFGSAVDVRGDALAVGVPSGSSSSGSSTITRAGGVELFGLVAGTWRFAAFLSAFGPGNTRGESVRLGGTRVVSGAPYAEGRVGVAGEACALYVGFRSGDDWLDAEEPLETNIDRDDDAAVTSGLGAAVALTDDTIAGGAPGLEEGRGRVYLFQSRAPTFDAPPSATPSVARLLDPIRFVAAASDPDGDDVLLFWDFGDGDGAATSPVTHGYRTAGGFDVRVLATDGIAETSATLRVDVAGPSSAMSQLEFTERVRQTLVPVGGGGEFEGEGDHGGGVERDLATTAVVKLTGVLSLSPGDVAALDGGSRFRIALGGFAVDVALGEDRGWTPGETKAKIVRTGGGDEGDGSVRYLTLRLDWRAGDLKVRLKAIPSQGFEQFLSDAIVADQLAGGPSGARAGTVDGAASFGPATAALARSYSAKVKTVDRETRKGRRYKSRVKVTAKGAP